MASKSAYRAYLAMKRDQKKQKEKGAASTSYDSVRNRTFAPRPKPKVQTNNGSTGAPKAKNTNAVQNRIRRSGTENHRLGGSSVSNHGQEHKVLRSKATSSAMRDAGKTVKNLTTGALEQSAGMIRKTPAAFFSDPNRAKENGSINGTAAHRMGLSQTGRGNGRQTNQQKLTNLYKRQKAAKATSDLKKAQYEAAREESLSASKLIEKGTKKVENEKKTMGKGGKWLADAYVGAVQLGADLTAGAVTGTGMVPMIARAAGGGIDEAEQAGATRKQSLIYGAATGGVEAATEKLFNVGKILNTGFGKGVGDDIVDKVIKKAASKASKQGYKDLAAVGGKWMTAAITEGLEEVIAEGVEPELANAIYDAHKATLRSDPGQAIKNMAYAGSLGAALGGIAGGGGVLMEHRSGKRIMDNNDGEELKKAAKTAASVDDRRNAAKAQAMHDQLESGAGITSIQVNELAGILQKQAEENRKKRTDAGKVARAEAVRNGYSDISPELMDAKRDEEEKRAADYINSRDWGDEDVSKAAGSVARIRSGQATDEDIDTIVHNAAARTVFEEMSGRSIPDATNSEIRDMLYTYNAKSIVDLAETQTKADRDQAYTRLVTESDYGAKGQRAFSKIMAGENVDTRDQEQTSDLKKAFDLYYNGARSDYSFSDLQNMFKDDPRLQGVDIATRRAAFEAGVNDNRNQVYERAQAQENKIRAWKGEGVPGKVDTSELADKSRVTPEELALFSDIADTFGLEIRIKGSAVDEDGKKNQNESVEGSYDKRVVTLSTDANRSLLSTFKHEITHHLEDYAPTEWAALRNFVVDNWDMIAERTGQDPDLNGVIERKIDLYKRHGQKLDREGAIKEIIAETPRFFSDEAIVDEIAKTNRTLAARVLDAIRDILRKIRAVIAQNGFENTRWLQEDRDTIKQAERMWIEALGKARARRDVGIVTDGVRLAIDDDTSIKQQIREHMDELSEMEPVADVHHDSISGLRRSEKADVITEEYRKEFGDAVRRDGLGEIEISYKIINGGLKYMHTDGEYLSFFALPYVLRDGKEIYKRDDHKHRAYDTVTIAAPVTVNGVDGYMGAVVKLSGKNRYRAHRIISPDGTEFELIDEKKTEPIGADVIGTETEQRPAISSASNEIINEAGEDVNNERLSLAEDYATLTPERIDSLIEEYAIPRNDASNYSKAWIATINPRDFLTLTVADDVLDTWQVGTENEWGQEVRELDTEDLKKTRRMPYLKIDSSDSHSIIGHEGRHRMLAMMRAGITESPVVIQDISEATKQSKQREDSMDLWSQDFGSGPVNDTNEGMGADVEAYDLIPINEKNRGEIDRLYGGDTDVQFSIAEDVDSIDNVNDAVRFSLTEDQMDPGLVEQLNNDKPVKVYRAMQYFDGKLYPPMAAIVDGRLNGGTEIGKWEQSEENLDQAVWRLKSNGKNVDKDTPGAKPYFILWKRNNNKNGGKGDSVPARYNPYIHTSLTPLNDQFSTAYKRPNMVVVEGYVPESELTSGYKAEHAKDAVGETEWKSGPVAGELKKKGKPRRVILSRYFKPVRVVPDSEVAETIAGIMDGTGVSIPAQVVTPQLREELESHGVDVDYSKVPKDFDTDQRFSISDNELAESVRSVGPTDKAVVDEPKTRYSLRGDLEANYKPVVLADGATGELYTTYDGEPVACTVIDMTEEMMRILGKEDQVEEMRDFRARFMDFMQRMGAKYEFIGLEDVNDATIDIRRGKDGNPVSVVLSAMVKNGEYPVNFDFSSICKKREAVTKLINDLSKREGGEFINKVSLSQDNLWALNEILRDEGFETACLGCFVETKRYNIEAWADSFVEKWNNAVEAVAPGAEYFDFGGTETTSSIGYAVDVLEDFKAEKARRVDDLRKKRQAAQKRWISKYKKDNPKATDKEALKAYKEHWKEREGASEYSEDWHNNPTLANDTTIEALVQSDPRLRKKLKRIDLITPEGITGLRQLNPDTYGVLYGHYGSGTPKPMQPFTPYNSEIAMIGRGRNANKKPNPESTRKNNAEQIDKMRGIGGLRTQSFSDFLIQNVYDYVQMIADMAARDFPGHAYSKEIAFAKIFGMTGLKINMSIMFDIDPDAPNPGLDKEGNYIIADRARQESEAKKGNSVFAFSFPWEEAVKLQNDPRYDGNVGTIGVGLSDAHIFKMLDDPEIKFIIPYHKSSLPKAIAKASHLEMATDYTDTQNTVQITGVIEEIDPKGMKRKDWIAQFKAEHPDVEDKEVDKIWRTKKWDHLGDYGPDYLQKLYKEHGSWGKAYEAFNAEISGKGYTVKTKKAGAETVDFEIYTGEYGLDNTKDPKETAEKYFEYCAENGWLPLFYQFAGHENYYKVLYDFNVYKSDGTFAPQEAVTNTYPDDVFDIIESYMKEANEANEEGAKAWAGVVEKAAKTLEERTANINTENERFSISEPVERVGNLVAVHNLQEKELLRSIELGGLPMPSIAVTKPELGHDKYGEISLLFGSDTIDPKKSRYNKVFGGDAYTPTFPTIEKKWNRKVADNIEKTVKDLIGADEATMRDMVMPLFDDSNLDSKLKYNDVYDAFKDNDPMKFAFLKSIGKDVEIPKMQVKMLNLEEAAWKKIEAVLPEELVLDDLAWDPDVEQATLEEYSEDIIKAIDEYVDEKYKDNPKRGLLARRRQSGRSVLDRYGADIIRHALEYRENGMPERVDNLALNEIAAEVDREYKAEYKEWLKNLFDGIVEAEGIWNGKDAFTPSGSRRSWRSMHDPVTLDNIVEAMRREKQAGKGAWGGASALASSQKRYGNLDEIRADEDRLEIVDEDYYDELQAEAMNMLDEAALAIAYNEGNTHVDMNYLVEEIGDILETTTDEEGIRRRLEDDLYVNVTDEQMDAVMDALDMMRELPTGYFEAKPARAVKINEIRAAVIPRDASQELKDGLEENDIPVIEYDRWNADDRKEKLNQAADEGNLRFSIPSEDDTFAWLADNQEELIGPEDDMSGVPVADRRVNLSRARREKSLEEIREAGAWVRRENETKLTRGRRLNPNSVREDANRMVRELMVNSDTNRKTSNSAVKRAVAAAQALRPYIIDDDLDAAADLAYDAALDIIEDIDIINDDMYQQYASLRDYFKGTRIRIPEADRGSDYNELRKKNVGRLRITNDGTELDALWSEICGDFPGLFNPETNGMDRLAEIDRVLDQYADFHEEFTSEEMDSLACTVASELVNIAAEGEEERTFADRKKALYDAKTKALKERHREAMKNAREKAKERQKKAVEKERRKRKEAVQKEREKAKADRKKRKEKADQRLTDARERGERRLQEQRNKEKARNAKRRDSMIRKDALRKMERNVKWLSDRLLNPTDDKHLPEGYRRAVAQLLSTLNLQTARSKELDAKYGLSKKTFKWLELKKQYEEIARGETYGFVLDEELIGIMETLSETLEDHPLSDVTTDELRDIYKVVKAIRHGIANQNKAFSEALKEGTDQLGMETIAEANERYRKNGNKARLDIGFLTEGMATPRDYFEGIGGGLNRAFMALRDGMDTHIRDIDEIRTMFTDVFGDYAHRKKPGSELESWRDNSQTREFKLASGGTIELNPAQIMSLYCLMKREQAQGHILGSGIIASEVRASKKIKDLITNKDGTSKRRKIREAFAGRSEATRGTKELVTYDDIVSMIGTLTEDQIAMADKMQEVLNSTMSEWGNETSMRMFGYRKFDEENYFPIKVEREYLASDFDVRGTAERVKNPGFSKGTVKNASNPIVIADIFEVVADHCNAMSMYRAFAPAIADFQRVFNYIDRADDGTQLGSVKEAIKAAYGQNALKYIERFMTDLNGTTPKVTESLTNIATKALANYKKAAIGFNMRVALQQPTAIIRAFSMISPKYFVGVNNPLAERRQMQKYCPIAMWKSWGFNNVDMARSMEEIMMNQEWSRIDAVTMQMYGRLDELTWGQIWAAVKRETKAKHKDVEVGSQEFWDLCNARASEIYDKTQVVDSVFHKSQMMRNSDVFSKMTTSFMAEPTRTFNMMWTQLRDAYRLHKDGENGKAILKANRALTVFVANAATCAAAAAIADALRNKGGDGDDDDRDMWTKYIDNLIANFKDMVNPLLLLPLVKDVWGFKDGFGSSNMTLEGYEKMVEAWMDIVTGNDNKTTGEKIRALAEGIGYVTGIPTKNAFREVGIIFKALGIEAQAAEKEEPQVSKKMLELFGVEDGDTADNILNRFGFGLSEAEQREKKIRQSVKEIQSKTKGLEGYEAQEKAWEMATKGYSKLIEEGDFATVNQMRDILKEAGGDVDKFDKKVISKCKSTLKQNISDTPNQAAVDGATEYMLSHGMTEADISSEVIAKSDVAKSYKEAIATGDDEKSMEYLGQMFQAGLTFEDFVAMRDKAEAKATGEFTQPLPAEQIIHRTYRNMPMMNVVAPEGTNVGAPDNGKVTSVGWKKGYGYTVTISHGNGYTSYYNHLADYSVQKGDIVRKGQVFARCGSSGDALESGVGIKVKKSGEWVDPEELFYR